MYLSLDKENCLKDYYIKKRKLIAKIKNNVLILKKNLVSTFYTTLKLTTKLIIKKRN